VLRFAFVLVSLVLGGLGLGGLLGACYQPTFGSCRLACLDACPAGLTCLADGYCHEDPGEALCTGDPDGGVALPDGRPDGNLMLGDGGVVPCTPAANDTAATALDLVGGGTVCLDLAGTTDNHSTTCASDGSRDLFFELTLTQSQSVYYDTFGSDGDVAVTTYYGDCDTIATAIGAGCEGPVCGGLGAQRVVDLSNSTTCFVIDELTPQSGGRVVFHVVPMGKGGFRLESGATLGPLTCAESNVVTSGACAATYAAPESAGWFTLCPGESVAPKVTISVCDASAMIVSLRRDTLANEIDCALFSPCQNEATFESISGPGPYWMIFDGPTAADCADIQVIADVTP